MPFLQQPILIKLLKTYPGAEKIEAKYNALIREHKGKDNPPSFLKYVRDKLKDGSSKIMSTSARWFGYNTTEDSEACYLEIRALIDDATRNRKIDAWTDILCMAGEGGYHTYVNSAVQSKLCHASYALLMYIRNSVTDKIKSIKDPENTNDPDEQLALQIDKAIKERIQLTKDFIDYSISAIKLGVRLKFSNVFSNTLEVNVAKMKNHTEVLKDAIDIAHRHLLYLGNDSLKKNAYIKSSQELFDGLPFYSIEIQKKYNLTDDQVKAIELHLPLYLQEIYPSLYIRDHRKDLFSVQAEEKVIKSFEELEKIIAQDNKADDQKILPRKMTPSSTLVQLPDRSSVTRLKMPMTPRGQQIADVEDAFVFSDVSDEKLILLASAINDSGMGKPADILQTAIPSAVVIQDLSAPGPSVLENKSKGSGQKIPTLAQDDSISQSSENGFFQAKSTAMNKGKSKHKVHASENKPGHR